MTEKFGRMGKAIMTDDTGEVAEPILGREAKVATLQEVSQRLGVQIELEEFDEILRFWYDRGIAGWRRNRPPGRRPRRSARGR